MRLLFFLSGIMVWQVAGLGAEPSKPASPPAALSPIPMNQAEANPGSGEFSGESVCEDEAGMVECRRIRPYGKLLDKWASYGQFNCGCSGSYKYPVPPQYTYHWPGMYSQPTMTQYVSPYRFPPLKMPPKGEDILQTPEEEKNVSERITIRPIRAVSAYQPLGR